MLPIFVVKHFVRLTTVMIVLLYISYQMQSSVSVNRILVRMVEHVGNMLSATCVSVCRVSMVPCVSLVSKKKCGYNVGGLTQC